MKSKIVKVITLTIITCFSTSVNATTVGIVTVDMLPEEPLETDIIRFDIFGQASCGGSHVEYEQFAQNGTLLQLDLYIDMGIITMISNWTYSKDIPPLSAETYTLEVRAFDYHFGTLEDTYTVDFTVIPEPGTLAIFYVALPFFRSFSRRK